MWVYTTRSSKASSPSVVDRQQSIQVSAHNMVQVLLLAMRTKKDTTLKTENVWQEEKSAKMDKRLASRQVEVLNKHTLEINYITFNARTSSVCRQNL